MTPPSPDRRHASSQKPGHKKQIEEILDVLYRRRWIIVAALVIALAGAAVTTFTKTPIYQTSAIVLVDLGRSSGGGNNSRAPIVESDLFVRDNRSVATELFILNTSRGIRERVTERFTEEAGQPLPGRVSFSQASREVPNAILIGASSPDPAAAAALANAYAEEYVNQTQTSSRSYLTATREFLEEQAERLRGELNAAEGDVAGQMARAGTAQLGGSSLINRLSSLKAQRDGARIDLQTRQYKLSSINDRLSDITPHLAQRMSSNTQRRYEEIDALIAQRVAERRPYDERLAAGRSIDRTAYDRIQRQIADLQREKTSLAGSFVGEVMDAGGILAPQNALSYVTDLKGNATQEQIEISATEGAIRQLNRQIAEIEHELSRVPGQITAIERVQRDRSQAASMYQSVVSRLQEVKIKEESEPGYARVLREAPTPGLPVGTNPWKTLAFALLGGLGAGVALAIGRDKVDNRIHKPEHIAALGVPVLEALPDLEATIKDEHEGAPTIEVGGRAVVTELVTLHSPLSPASETYRHLRTAIQFSRPDAVVQTIVVSSAAAGEGKSTTASNLAVTFAQAGRKTALIDADIRRPRIHDIFGAPAAPGLGQILELGAPTPDALRVWLDGAFTSPVDDLYVIPTGAIAAGLGGDFPDDGRLHVTNPSEMLGSPAFRALLSTLHQIVDVVIIDTPPVLAATDAVILSTQADATLLVASAGKTKTGDVEQALAHLTDVGARVVGAALNRFSLKNALGYAYTYGHYSRYGPYSEYGYYAESLKAGRKRRRTGRTSASAPSEEASA